MLATAAYAAQPRNPKPSTPDEVYQNDLDLYDAFRLGEIPSQTKAQLQSITPKKAGLIYYCSDCTTDGVVVSTGTGRGAFGRISARSTAIN